MIMACLQKLHAGHTLGDNGGKFGGNDGIRALFKITNKTNIC